MKETEIGVEQMEDEVDVFFVGQRGTEGDLGYILFSPSTQT